MFHEQNNEIKFSKQFILIKKDNEIRYNLKDFCLYLSFKLKIKTNTKRWTIVWTIDQTVIWITGSIESSY